MLSRLSKSLIFCVISATLLLQPITSSSLYAWRCVEAVGGHGYVESKTCPTLAPATLFALVTLGAIIAVAIKAEKNENDHGHTHGHSSSNGS